jgi:catechol 2,3-dioxygenase-like lactoylglutathione lyase family enzyme
MPPAYVSVVTIGVRDLRRMRAFYAALGWAIAVDMDDWVPSDSVVGGLVRRARGDG